MDQLLIIFAGLLMVLGLIGSFLPVLPGPLTSWFGLLILYLIPNIDLRIITLLVTLIIAILIWVLDYIIPAMGTKRFGGTKAGMIGTTIGLIVGILSPIPGGIILGPLAGSDQWKQASKKFKDRINSIHALHLPAELAKVQYSSRALPTLAYIAQVVPPSPDADRMGMNAVVKCLHMCGNSFSSDTAFSLDC